MYPLSIRTALLCLLYLLVLGLTACAGSANPPPICGEHNCSGCCKGSLCITKTDKNSCGVKGGICDVCDSDQICSKEGECEAGEEACRPSKCNGCCKGTRCVTQISDLACGKLHGICSDCTKKDQKCNKSTKVCADDECKPNCVGKCKGDKDSCGGKCPISDCKGCCDGVQCITKTSDDACGQGGGDCVKCDCNKGECPSCPKDCVGKCAGASDRCGGTCPGDCDGCCEEKVCRKGDDNEICGGKGIGCEDCKEKGKTCEDNACDGCAPDCKNKCKGAPDSCNGTCASNSCTGCCDKITKECITPVTEAACGEGGDDCEVCKADFEGWSWKCDDAAGDCVHDQKLGTACTGEVDGTTACTENNVNGKCWDEACCTGCWDKGAGYCHTVFWDDDCGAHGIECVDCTTDGEFCKAGKCSELGPNGCANELGRCEDIAGLDGRCLDGQCCSGCFYVDIGGQKACNVSPDEEYCGIDGETCDSCDWTQFCDGDCVFDPDISFQLGISSGEISGDLPDLEDPSSSWDDCCGGWTKPDAEVHIAWDVAQCDGTSAASQTDICSGLNADSKDTFTPTWQYDAGWVDAGQILTEFCLSVVDEDALLTDCGDDHEIIGQCKVQVTEAELLLGYKEITYCPNPDNNHEYIESLIITFSIPVP